jgi:hypothetical protein
MSAKARPPAHVVMLTPIRKNREAGFKNGCSSRRPVICCRSRRASEWTITMRRLSAFSAPRRASPEGYGYDYLFRIGANRGDPSWRLSRLLKKAHLRRRLSSEGGPPPFRTFPKLARAKPALERRNAVVPPCDVQPRTPQSSHPSPPCIWTFLNNLEGRRCLSLLQMSHPRPSSGVKWNGKSTLVYST